MTCVAALGMLCRADLLLGGVALRGIPTAARLEVGMGSTWGWKCEVAGPGAGARAGPGPLWDAELNRCELTRRLCEELRCVGWGGTAGAEAPGNHRGKEKNVGSAWTGNIQADIQQTVFSS